MSTIKVDKICGPNNEPALGVTPNGASNLYALATKKFVDDLAGGVSTTTDTINNLLGTATALENAALEFRTNMQPSETGVTDFRVFAANQKQAATEAVTPKPGETTPIVKPIIYDKNGYTVDKDGNIVNANGDLIQAGNFVIGDDGVIRTPSGEEVTFNKQPEVEVKPTYYNEKGYTVDDQGRIVDAFGTVIKDDKRYTIGPDRIIRDADTNTPVDFNPPVVVKYDANGYTVDSNGWVVDRQGNIIRNDQLFIMGDDLIIRFASSGNPVDFNYTDPNAGKHTTVGGIEFVDENGESIGGGTTSSTIPPTNHESGKNTTVGGIEFI